MTTIYLEHLSYPSFFVGDVTYYPNVAESTLVGSLLSWSHLIPQSQMLLQGHCIFSLLYVQLVLEKNTPPRPATTLLKISQPWSLTASDRLSDPTAGNQ